MLDLAPFITSGWIGVCTALVIGTAFGFIAGLTPGLGGKVGIILSLPVAIFWDPLGAAVFLFSMHAVVHTSSSIPAIAFALPSTGGDAATILDGHPLAKMGRGGEALGASLSASALGGLIGAAAFLICIPVARTLIAWFGPPEFLVLAIAGLSMVATLSGRKFFAGLLVGLLGLLLSMVGRDIMTSASRFTFGRPELLDGLSLTPLVGGLFVVPEMLSRWRIDTDGVTRAVKTSVRDVLRGTLVTLRYLPLVFRSSLYGIGVGIMPGVGSSVSVWLSYDYAARTVKSEIPFGSGAIAGVIAPEAANNAKEGGAMVPTLFFGIPGSSSMAIMLAALHVVGQTVGPSLLSTDLNISLVLALTIVVSNLLAVPMFFAIIPWIVRLTALKRDHIVPFAISISLFAALMQDMNLLVLVQFAVGGLIGLALKWVGWPRAPFLLGFVLGPIAEISYVQTSQIWGLSMFLRPATIIMLVLFGFGFLRALAGMKSGPRTVLGRVDGGIGLLTGGVFATALAVAFALPAGASPAPVIVSVLGLALSMTIVWFALRPQPAQREPLDQFSGLWATAALCLMVPVAGLPIASAGYTIFLLRRLRVRRAVAIAGATILAAVQLGLLSLVLDLRAEPLISGQVMWWLLNRG